MAETCFNFNPETGQLTLEGEWTTSSYRDIKKKLNAELAATDKLTVSSVDGSDLSRIDSNGASLLFQWFDYEALCAAAEASESLKTQHKELLLTVLTAQHKQEKLAPDKAQWGDWLESLGRQVHEQLKHSAELFHFVGITLTTLISVLVRPWRWRLISFFYHMQHSGLNAVPIVALLTFLVGAVVAFLGATVLRDFGATIYTVDLVAYGFMRELGVLLAAILLAGRTASAFTAQIGSMKVNEEIDAMRVQGLNPVEMLVIPRLIALVIMLPILAFIGVIAGITGGAAVAIFALDISTTQFLHILQEIPIKHFWIGLSKAPLFAAVIAIIGCLEGFKVGSSAASVGTHTTSSVVQSIFIVILFDALAALFFMEMGW